MTYITLLAEGPNLDEEQSCVKSERVLISDACYSQHPLQAER